MQRYKIVASKHGTNSINLKIRMKKLVFLTFFQIWVIVFIVIIFLFIIFFCIQIPVQKYTEDILLRIYWYWKEFFNFSKSITFCIANSYRQYSEFPGFSYHQKRLKTTFWKIASIVTDDDVSYWITIYSFSFTTV